MKRFATLILTTTAVLTASASYAQDSGASQPGDEKINQLIVYGNDKCPESTGDEIVVCARMDEADRYRIPSNLRGDPNDPRNQAMSERIKAYEYVGASGTMSCSPSGAGRNVWWRSICACMARFWRRTDDDRPHTTDD